MRILFIGKRFYTNRDAYRERFGRIYQLPYWWAEEGHSVDLWLIDYHSRERCATRDGSLAVESTPVLRGRFFGRLIAACFGSKHGRPDVVVASGDCYVGLLGYLIARLRSARFVFDVYDRYDLFDGYRRFLGFDPLTFLIRRADDVSFASAAVLEDFGHLAGSTLPVPNGIDLELFSPLPMEESRRRHDLPAGASIIGYFGSMEPERGVEDLLDAVAGLVERGVELKLIVGGKVDSDINFEYPWVHYLGNLEYKRMPTALASCDLLALPYRQSEFMDKGASCKIAEYISVRRPIVATRTQNLVANYPEQARELDGLLAEPGNAADLERCILAQLSERRLVSMPKGGDWKEISQHALARLEAEGIAAR